MTDIAALESYAGILSESAQRSVAASHIHHDYIHGDDQTDVLTESGWVPSLAKQARIADANNSAKIKGFSEKAVTFNKSIRLSLPLSFQDHAAALVAVGSPAVGYLYPQGHCYDAADNLYMAYANGNRCAIAWYDTNGVYGGWFLIENGGESVVVIEEGGTRKLYKKGGSNRLYAYDITVMPANGAILAFTDVGLSGVGLQYAYDNGKWLIEQSSPDVGSTGSRTKWNIYNRAFEKTGDFYVAKNIVGWQLAESPHYPHIPKTQGVALRGDKVIFGLGGSYIPEIEGPVAPKSSSLGVAVCDLDGNIAGYGTLRADKLITRLVSDGHICARTESEGVSLRPDGSISQIVITVRPGHAAQTTAGILIFTELDIYGDDYSDIAETYTPFNMDRTQAGVFPRSADGKMYDPFSGELLSTLASIIAFMWDVQVPRFAWYTSAVSVTPLGEITFPAAMLVQVFSGNNLTFIVSVSGTGGFNTIYSVNYNPTAGTFSVTKLPSDVARLRLGEIESNTNVNGRIVTPHQSATDADLLAMQQLSTPGGNLLALGGGSSLYYACTRMWTYVGATLTTKIGTLITETIGSGFNPGATGLFSLGSGGKLWSQLFASTATISTSDERSKAEIQSVDSLVLDAWATVDYAQFKMLDAVEAKGGAARWHFGVIAQRVQEAFEAFGLDPFAYGVLCYDTWEEEAEVIESWEAEVDEYGVITREAGSHVVRPHLPAGNRYGIRYEEALVLEAALMRRAVNRLQVAVASLTP